MSTLSGGPNIVLDGLVFNLDCANTRSYTGSGTLWRDVSRNSSNVTLVNGPTFNSSNGGSIVFDGTNDYGITNANVSSLNILSGLTIDVWLRTTQVANSLHGDGVVSKGLSADNNSAVYEMMLRNVSGTNYLQLRIRTSTTNTYFSTGTSINLNQIYNVTATYNGSFMRTFVNSVEVGTGSTVSGLLASNNEALTVGVRYLMRDNPSNDSYFTGNIYNVKIYNRGLTQPEIVQNFNTLRSRFNI